LIVGDNLDIEVNATPQLVYTSGKNPEIPLAEEQDKALTIHQHVMNMCGDPLGSRIRVMITSEQAKLEMVNVIT